MSAPRAIGLAAVMVILPLAGLCRCASGGSKPEPAATPAATETSAPAPATGPGRPAPVDFAAQVLPLLQQKCSPCHFQGGRMYDRLPFDQEGTIRVLGTQMFSRLRDPLDQELIRTYLEQP
jgi:hypothetical protein